jgi:hypothetical protein
MANQVTVSNDHSISVTIEPPANVQVQVSRAVIGTVANVASANFANYATNVIGANQPNITNIGTLANLSVTNTATIGNLIVTGNLSVGNLVANNANYANFAGIANTANTVAGANVTGTVANATYAANAGNATIANSANSVALANVSGAGNIASINLDGNASNILFGNGIFSAIPVVSNVANANYANFAGTAFSVSGSNVSGEVANAAYANAANTANLATYATTANSVAGANVSGTVANATFALDAGNSNLANTANSVAVANVSGIGNIATVNLDGNASNILYGNGVFATTPIISNVANANYANFAGTAFSVSGSNVSGEVANAAYANAANTANLATFATTANSVAGANVSGTVANAAYADNAGNSNIANLATFATTANAVAGANVSGEVANANFASYANLASTANLATYATTANSVAGANVSGEVANANYASFANVASSANSVALANVSGIGNIANINLDGSSSNVLFGNGIFAPESTSIANANYANFAGTLINGNSNVTIPSANGNIVFTAGGNSDVVKITTTGAINSIPTSGTTSSYIINSYDTGADSKRISSFKYRGNIATPLSVNPSDTTMRLITIAHNGAALQTNSTASIRGLVDASYTANGANIPLGWSFQVNDTVGGTTNQQRTHNFYANGNVNFANSVVVTNDLTVSTGNITATAGILNGNGSGLSQLTGANVTGQVPYANVANSVAVANVVGIGNIATINLTGSSSNVLYGNGVFAPESTNIANANYANFAGTLINGNSNISFTAANGSIQFNPVGNANVARIDGNGSMFTTPLAGGYNNWLSISTNYGTAANGQNASRLSSFRYRGSSGANLSVEPNDSTIDIVTGGYNGSILQTSSLARIRSNVDSSYVANGTNIPLGWQVIVNDTNGGINNQSKTHNFYANGNVTFASSITSTANIQGANVRATALFRGLANTLLGDSSNLAAATHQLYGNTNLNGNVFVGGGVANGSSLIMNYGNNGIQVLDGNIQVQNANGNGGYLTGTYVRSYDSLEIRALGQPANVSMYSANGAVTTIGTVTAANVQISANGFTKLASYTEAALTAITGQIGWIAAVSDSAGGSHPNGMIAFWDTTNSRWSYIHDNSAV